MWVGSGEDEHWEKLVTCNANSFAPTFIPVKGMAYAKPSTWRKQLHEIRLIPADSWLHLDPNIWPPLLLFLLLDWWIAYSFLRYRDRIACLSSVTYASNDVLDAHWDQTCSLPRPDKTWFSNTPRSKHIELVSIGFRKLSRTICCRVHCLPSSALW